MRYYLLRSAWALRQWPLRLRRLVAHRHSTSPTRGKDALLLLGDLLFLFDAYELAATLVSPRIRRMTPAEIATARCVFGDSLPYPLIRIDQRARIATRRYHIAYVSFLTVNAWGTLPPALLQHELIHCWQYVHRGSAYIARALWAQRTAFGYDYRGVAHLRTLNSLFELNYEQQGDVVSDHYRLTQGLSPRWGNAGGADLPVYERLLRELRSDTPPETA